MSLQSLTHSLQMYTDGPETSRATSSCPRPQNEQRMGCGVAMRFFMTFRPLGRMRFLRALVDDLVDETVRLRVLGRHEIVPVGVLLDLIEGPTGVPGEDAVQLAFDLQHLP